MYIYIWLPKDQIMITSLFLGLLPSGSYSTHSQFNLPHTPSTLHFYRSASLLEFPCDPFVALKRVCLFVCFFLSAVGEMGKGRRIRWQMVATQGIKCTKNMLDRFFFPPNISVFHPFQGFCNLEDSKLCLACLLSVLSSSLSFLAACWLFLKNLNRKETCS